jgi:A/G-specific adenine glycosylase
MMLVQTTVAAVTPFFERFVARFPTLESLAAADEAEVVRMWEGLGYYRRARHLHAAARAIVALHGGSVPDEPALLAQLPGIGRYIAGAVASIAFDRQAPIVEANTQRVLARLLACTDTISDPRATRRLWEAAERLVPPTGARVFNQAIMELGATICTPRRPSCLICPVARECRARARGTQESIPRMRVRPAPLEVVEACALVVRDARLLLVQRGSGSLWEGFWELPTANLSGPDPAGRHGTHAPGSAIEDKLRAAGGVAVAVGPALRTVRYTVTKHRVTLTVHGTIDRGGAPAPGPGLTRAEWVEPQRLNELIFSSPMRKLVTWAASRMASGQSTA